MTFKMFLSYKLIYNSKKINKNYSNSKYLISKPRSKQGALCVRRKE